MSAAGIGAAAGGVLGFGSSLANLRAENKAIIGQITRDLGDVLSENALATAKNMATAKVLMSTSGTIGGTTSQVSKQAYMEQILADAEQIKVARNREIGQLTEAISRQMNYRMQADAMRSKIKSPLEAVLQTATATIQGASAGASVGSSFNGIGDIGINRGGNITEYNPFKSHVTPRYKW